MCAMALLPQMIALNIITIVNMQNAQIYFTVKIATNQWKSHITLNEDKVQREESANEVWNNWSAVIDWCWQELKYWSKSQISGWFSLHVLSRWSVSGLFQPQTKPPPWFYLELKFSSYLNRILLFFRGNWRSFTFFSLFWHFPAPC